MTDSTTHPDSIFDIDNHLSDASPEMWQPYFRGQDAAHLPRVGKHDGTDRLLAGGLFLPKPSGPGVGSPLGIGAAAPVKSLEDRLAFMDAMWIRDASVTPVLVGL